VSTATGISVSFLVGLVTCAVSLLLCAVARGVAELSTSVVTVLAISAVHASSLAVLVQRVDTRASVAVPSFLALAWLLPSALVGHGHWIAAVRSIFRVAPDLRPPVESSDISAVMTIAPAAASTAMLLLAAAIPRRSER
jgi:hypothetical protein